MVVAKGWGRQWELVLNEDKVSFWEDNKFLRMDGVNVVVHNVNVLNATELDTENG